MKTLIKNTLKAALFSTIFLSLPVLAEEEKGPNLDAVSTEVKGTAVGYYARSRSLIIAAINEFDRGYKTANSDQLIDSAKLRANLIEAAQELEKVLDPQSRETRGGIKYEADPRLLNEANR